MASRLVTAEEREEIRRLHGEAKGCNEIAKLLRRSGMTISAHVEALGLPWSCYGSAASCRSASSRSTARRPATTSATCCR
ncbi:hypothetical protein J7E96_24325 [Streptomyces sp. ISL-96]|uniref:helix-turn-helix domain-containing protein n=1 Tax=Streptomyces sp. ISL-96 TaxID=2819191 RepID=UPI001BE5DF9E|nr:helix-turn-helix domain-containing protein [Streptomyces sp. ISL-96]MBT2491597.1 hypothetical protein [Streptomyces sp. ISL-96]